MCAVRFVKVMASLYLLNRNSRTRRRIPSRSSTRQSGIRGSNSFISFSEITGSSALQALHFSRTRSFIAIPSPIHQPLPVLEFGYLFRKAKAGAPPGAPRALEPMEPAHSLLELLNLDLVGNFCLPDLRPFLVY